MIGRQRKEPDMDDKNIDIYGDPPMPWSRPLDQLNTFVAGPPNGTWPATARPDGRPHVTGIGAVWLDDRFYFTSRLDTRKSRNLAENPSCAISLELPDIDLVVEGTAAIVDDDATLERLVAVFRDQGWPANVK